MGMLSIETLMNLKHSRVFHLAERVSNTALNMCMFKGVFPSKHGNWRHFVAILLIDGTYFHVAHWNVNES